MGEKVIVNIRTFMGRTQAAGPRCLPSML